MSSTFTEEEVERPTVPVIPMERLFGLLTNPGLSHLDFPSIIPHSLR